MADTKLSALGSATLPLDPADLVLVTQGGASLSAPRSAMGKVLLDSITNATADEFAFSAISGDYNRLIIEGLIEGDVSATTDALNIYFNTDTATNDTDYYSQVTTSTDAAVSTVEAASPQIGVIAGATAVGPSEIRIVIEDYAGSELKRARGASSAYRVAGSELSDHKSVVYHDSMTAAITQVLLRTDNHATDQLLGTLRLYGE